jgi:hypothetical protein
MKLHFQKVWDNFQNHKTTTKIITLDKNLKTTKNKQKDS